MRASQEQRWKQSIKENEERRRRYEEASKRLEHDEKTKAQEALERRRQERARMDELMRNPAQQPAPPKKPILRKGAGSVLRAPATATSAPCTPTAAKVRADAVASSPERTRPELEKQRREWSEGLKQYITRQREALKGREDGQGSDQADALSWQELKLAAEAGFEELLQQQQAVAAQRQASCNANLRCPGMARPKGGGATVQPAAGIPVVATAETGLTLPPSSAACAGLAAAVKSSNSSSPTSKWAVRMNQMLDKAMQGPCMQGTSMPTPAGDDSHAAPKAVGPDDCSSIGHGAATVATPNAVQHVFQDKETEPSQARQQLGKPAGMQAAVPDEASAETAVAVFAAAAATCSHDNPGDELDMGAYTSYHVVPEAQQSDACVCIACSTCTKPHAATLADEEAAGSVQHMPASAQQATAALRESMEKLHRATEVMLLTARRSQQAVTTKIASQITTSRPEISSCRSSMECKSPADSCAQRASNIVAETSISSSCLEPIAAVVSDSTSEQPSLHGPVALQQASLQLQSSAHQQKIGSPDSNLTGQLQDQLSVCPDEVQLRPLQQFVQHAQQPQVQHFLLQDPDVSSIAKAGHNDLQHQEHQLLNRESSLNSVAEASPCNKAPGHQTYQPQQHTADCCVQHDHNAPSVADMTGHLARQQDVDPANRLSDPASNQQCPHTAVASSQQQMEAVAENWHQPEFAAGWQQSQAVAAVQLQSAVAVDGRRQEQTTTDGQQQPEVATGGSQQAETAAADSAVHDGPTLDSLLAEVQQLVALRKALKAEFVALGHDNIAAAMGTLGLSHDRGLPAVAPVAKAENATAAYGEAQQHARQVPGLQQQQHPPLVQQQCVIANLAVNSSVERMPTQGIDLEQTPSPDGSRKQLQTVRVSTIKQFQRHIGQHAGSQQIEVAPTSAAVAGLASNGSVPKQQNQTQQLEHEQAVPAVLPSPAAQAPQQEADSMQMVLPRLKQPAGPLHDTADTLLQRQSQNTQQWHIPLEAAAGERPITTRAPSSSRHELAQLDTSQPAAKAEQVAEDASFEQIIYSLGSADGGDPGTAASSTEHAAAAGASSLTGSLATAQMDLSFSFGRAGGNQLMNHNPPSSLSPAAEGTGSFDKLHYGGGHMPLATVQMFQSQTEQVCVVQQQTVAVHQLVQHGTLVSGQQQHTTGPQISHGVLHQPAMAMQPLLQWSLPATSPMGGASAALTPAKVSAVSPVIPPGHESSQLSSGRGVTQPQPAPGGGCTAHYPVLTSGAEAAAPATCLAPFPLQTGSTASSSLCSSPTQRPAVSRWISSSPTSTRTASPLPSPGRAKAQPAAATSSADKPASSSTTTRPAGGKAGGFLDKLARQPSSSGRTPGKAGPMGSAAAKVDQVALRAPGIGSEVSSVPAAERPLLNQGSYLAAALQAKQRLEKEQAQKQKLDAAAAAAARAAAQRKLLDEMQEAERLAADKAAQQVVSVAVRSHAQASGEREQQCSFHKANTAMANASPAVETAPYYSGASVLKSSKSAQPSPPAVQNSGSSPPRRIVRNASEKKAAAAPATPQQAAPDSSRVAGSGVSSNLLPASKIPSAPGTPGSVQHRQEPPVTLQQNVAVAPSQHHVKCGAVRDAACNGALDKSFDSDFDHLERELATENNTAAANKAGSRQPVPTQQASSTAAAQQSGTAHLAATCHHGGMWQAVQAAAAAAMQRHAGSPGAQQVQQVQPPVAQHAMNNRPGASRPPILHIPASTSNSLAVSPAPAVKATAVQASSARLPSPLPPKNAASKPHSGIGQPLQPQQQQQQRRRQQRVTPGTAQRPTCGEAQDHESKAPTAVEAANRHSRSAIAVASHALTDTHRLSMEEAELLASLKQLDKLHARAKQQTAYSSNIYIPTAEPALAAQLTGVQAAAAASKSAMLTSNASKRLTAPCSATPENTKLSGTTAAAAGSARPQDMTKRRLSTRSTGAAASPCSSPPVPSPNKAKEQRQARLAAAPGAALKPTKQPAPPDVATAPAAVMAPVHSASAASGVWLGQWPQGNFAGMPVMHMPGQQLPGFAPPMVAWGDANTMQQHAYRPHAAAAMAAAAPPHIQQHNQLAAMYSQLPGSMGDVNQFYSAPGAAPYVPAAGQQFQPQHAYWAAMQAQQYQQWRQQQQQASMVYPNTAGDVVAYSRPSSGILAQMHPPQSAPGGSQYQWGSPLLPTLHYQQTVMRNRTSTAGDSGDSNSRRSSDGGGGLLPAASRAQASGWQQPQSSGGANIWPPRGIERKGGAAASGLRATEQGANGCIHVFKPGLLV